MAESIQETLDRLIKVKDELKEYTKKIKAELAENENTIWELKAENEKLKKRIRLYEKPKTNTEILSEMHEDLTRLQDTYGLTKDELRVAVEDCFRNMP